ncbi:unnamed protein product [Amoebophrya sp. A25]|nr:unnamed protein product [Amoebophrya sp. A25]|eukprot:GSA25T00022216001.1
MTDLENELLNDLVFDWSEDGLPNRHPVLQAQPRTEPLEEDGHGGRYWLIPFGIGGDYVSIRHSSLCRHTTIDLMPKKRAKAMELSPKVEIAVARFVKVEALLNVVSRIVVFPMEALSMLFLPDEDASKEGDASSFDPENCSRAEDSENCGSSNCGSSDVGGSKILTLEDFVVFGQQNLQILVKHCDFEMHYFESRLLGAARDEDYETIFSIVRWSQYIADGVLGTLVQYQYYKAAAEVVEAARKKGYAARREGIVSPVEAEQYLFHDDKPSTKVAGTGSPKKGEEKELDEVTEPALLKMKQEGVEEVEKTLLLDKTSTVVSSTASSNGILSSASSSPAVGGEEQEAVLLSELDVNQVVTRSESRTALHFLCLQAPFDLLEGSSCWATATEAEQQSKMNLLRTKMMTYLPKTEKSESQLKVAKQAKDLLETLLSDPRTDVNKLDATGRTAFKIAVEKRYKRVVEHFLYHASRVDVNIGKRSPLMSSIVGNSVNMVRLLLEQPRIDINLADVNGWTPIRASLEMLRCIPPKDLMDLTLADCSRGRTTKTIPRRPSRTSRNIGHDHVPGGSKKNVEEILSTTSTQEHQNQTQSSSATSSTFASSTHTSRGSGAENKNKAFSFWQAQESTRTSRFIPPAVEIFRLLLARKRELRHIWEPDRFGKLARDYVPKRVPALKMLLMEEVEDDDEWRVEADDDE